MWQNNTLYAFFVAGVNLYTHTEKKNQLELLQHLIYR